MLSTILALTTNYSRIETALSALGVPKDNEVAYNKLVKSALSADLLTSGDDATVRCEPSHSNSCLESIAKRGGMKGSDLNAISDALIADMEKKGKQDDEAMYLTLMIGTAMETTNGDAIGENELEHIRKQITFAMNKQGWTKARQSERTLAANVTQSLLIIELLAISSGDIGAAKTLCTTVLSSTFGEGTEVKLTNGWLSVIPKLSNSAVKIPSSDLTLSASGGFVAKKFGASRGFTKSYPNSPTPYIVSIVVQPASSRGWEDFMGAWSSVLPAGAHGKIVDIPFKRYFGDGARAMMGYGIASFADGRTTNILLYNVERLGGSQVVVVYYPVASLLSQILDDFEPLVRAAKVPDTVSRPLGTPEDLAGTWTSRGANTMGYFSTSTGDLVGAEVVDRNLEYFFFPDGTYKYKYAGVTGTNGSLTARDDADQGTYIIAGDQITLKPVGKVSRKYSFRGVIEVGQGKKALLLGQSGRSMSGELAYIEKFVTKG